jgi:hypothetical protein
MAEDITPAMNQEFERSKLYRLMMLLLQSGIVVVALCSIGRSGAWLKYSGIGALVATGLSFLLRYLTQMHFAKGEAFRRMLFYTKSQGKELPPHVAAVIATDFHRPAPEHLLREDEYYDSNAPVGYLRMLANIQESAFYTCKLARSSKIAFGLMTLIGAIIAVLYLIVVASAISPVDSVSSVSRAADVTMKLLAFFVLGQYSELWYSFAVLEKAAAETYRSSSELLFSRCAVGEEVLELVSGYDCALASSSPIPTPIWLIHKRALERGWDVIKNSRKVMTTIGT